MYEMMSRACIYYLVRHTRYISSKKTIVVHGRKKAHVQKFELKDFIRNKQKMYEGAAHVILGTLYRKVNVTLRGVHICVWW